MHVKNLLLCLIALCIAGCAPNVGLKLTPAEDRYLMKIKDAPMKFTIPAEEADEAWARAESFVSTYSKHGLKEARNNLVETNEAPEAMSNTTMYRITKLVHGRGADFAIRAWSTSPFHVRQAMQNGRILSYFIQTGERPPRRLVKD